MAGRYNRWLKAKLAERIRNNGGYRGSRTEKCALSWDVPFYNCIDTPEEAVEALIEEGHFVNEADLGIQFPDFEERFNKLVNGRFGEDHVYQHALERLQEDLTEDQGLCMWSPKTATRYGFDYKGVGAETPFNMEFAQTGRNGKHICLVRFEHENLNLSSEDLADYIDPFVQPDGPAYPNTWCRLLMGIMDELDAALTRENAERCGRYYATDFIARELGLFD